ncbi:hypothetical protein D1N78_16920, partial [Clostridioides difficile]
VINSSRSNNEKEEIIEEIKNIAKKNGLNYEKAINVEFKELSLENRIDLAKLKIYEWEKRNNLDIDVDALFDSLISNITQNLCTYRGFLSKNYINELALKYKSRKIDKNSTEYIKFVDNNVNSILEALKFDSSLYEMFTQQLNMTRFYISQNDFKNALKEIETIAKYEQEFQKYKFFLLNINEDYKKLKNYCIEVLKNDESNYYANYYLGIEYKKIYKYKKAIACFLNAIDTMDTFDVNYNLAEVYEKSGQINNSLKYYNRCLEKDSMNIRANLNISKLLPYNKAIEHLDIVISLDPEIYEAYLYKGKILRFLENIDEAFSNFQKYLKYREELEVIKEMALCMIDMNKKESNVFLSSWILESMQEELRELKDGESIIIYDILWNSSKVIICTKKEDDFIVQSPISSFKLMNSNTNNLIVVGLVEDRFLKATSEFLRKNGRKAEKGKEYLPCFIKSYDNKYDFDKFINSILEQKILHINKEYILNDEHGNEVEFREYISYESDVNIMMNDYNSHRFVEVNIGSSTINGYFKKVGDGFFAFESKLEEGTPFNEGIIILECYEASKIIHIKMSLDNIHSKKTLLYKYI